MWRASRIDHACAQRNITVNTLSVIYFLYEFVLDNILRKENVKEKMRVQEEKKGKRS